MSFIETVVQFSSGGVEYREIFSVPPQYSIVGTLGSGKYGSVVSAIDNTTGARVAIKKITGFSGGRSGIFQNRNDAKRILREIKIYKHFNASQHPNLIHIRGLFGPQTDYDSFTDTYIVFDCLDCTLQYILDSGQSLSSSHHKAFLLHILRGMAYVHQTGIIHRDLKPENILVTASCQALIADFGLARDVQGPDMYSTPGDYVVSLSWRAPELLLGASTYDASIDVWSVGVIFLQMVIGSNPFRGRDVLHTLANISRYLGTPRAAQFPHLNTTMRARLASGSAPTSGFGIDSLIPDDYPQRAELISLLNGMLAMDPRQRITIEQAIAHPFLRDEYVLSLFPAPLIAPAPEFNLDYESLRPTPLSSEEIRGLIYDEIREFYPRLPSRIPLSVEAQIAAAALPADQDTAAGSAATSSSMPMDDSTPAVGPLARTTVPFQLV